MKDPFGTERDGNGKEIGVPRSRHMSKSDTPRTDDEIGDARNFALDFNCRPKPKETDKQPLVVTADFARQLERELAAKNAELTLAKLDLDVARSGIDQLLKELEQSRAQVARLLLEASKFHDEQHEYQATNSCFVQVGLGKNKLDCEFKEFLVSLPEQSARDAEVLRAADKDRKALADTADYFRRIKLRDA